MTGVPYLPKNCRIVFREPFPRVEQETSINYGAKMVKYGSKKYYIKACIDGRPEKEFQISSPDQMRFLDDLIAQDKKLLNAVGECDNGKFYLVSHCHRWISLRK